MHTAVARPRAGRVQRVWAVYTAVYTGARVMYPAFTWPCTGRVYGRHTAVYGPYKRSCTRPVYIYTCVHGRHTACTGCRSVRTAVYVQFTRRAVYGPTTRPLYTVRVHVFPYTRAPRSPSPKRGRSSPPNFRPMFIVAKRLDGSRWHLAWR